MYSRSARYYDAIYSWKNYSKEADKLRDIIRRYKKSEGRTLLDVACGTGNHITYLKRHFKVEGLDNNPEMLKQARRKHPEIIFRLLDMQNFRLRKRYDVITCLFSAIGHLKTRARLNQVAKQMTDHLKPGGLLLLEPWITPDQWTIGRLDANFVNQSNLKIARFNISKRRGRRSINDMHHLVGSPDGISYFVERIESGLFTNREYTEALMRAGLTVRYNKKGLMGRGLYIGVKPFDKRIVPTISTPVR